MAYFTQQNTFFCRKSLNFKKFEKTADVKIEGNFQYFRIFKYSTFGQDVLHYIHEENLCLEQQ